MLYSCITVGRLKETSADITAGLPLPEIDLLFWDKIVHHPHFSHIND